MMWFHVNSYRKKFKVASTPWKVMDTVFLDLKGIILLEFMPSSAIINSYSYVSTLSKKMSDRQKMCDMFLKHNNNKLHSSLKSRQEITAHALSNLASSTSLS